MDQSSFKVYSPTDFANIDIGDPNLSPAAMLAYVLANYSALELRGKTRSKKNAETLSKLYGIEYHIMRHMQRDGLKELAHTNLGKDRISKSAKKTEAPYQLFNIIGTLGFIALQAGGHLQDICNQNFKIEMPSGSHLKLDEIDYSRVMRAILAVAPADHLKQMYELALEICSDPEMPKGSVMHTRALWFRTQAIQTMEKRAKTDIKINHWLLPDFTERTGVVAAIAKIRMDETFDKLTDGIPVSKVDLNNVERRVHAIYDDCAAKAEEARRKIDQKPTPIPRTVDRIKTPFDVLSLILLGENSLVASR